MSEQATTPRHHVCIVTETYPPEINGVALTLARLASGLRARGHAVSVVRPRPGAGEGPGDGSEMLVVRGLPLLGYPTLRVGLPAGRVLRAGWTTRRPDVVYVATEGPLGWSAVRMARRLGIPVLSGFHTNFHGYARHYGLGWLQPLLVCYLRRFHNRTLGTLVASVDLRNQLRARGFTNLSVLGRGVDRELFTPARRSPALRRAWGVSGGDLVALYVGRLAPEKNIALAVEAYRAMRRGRSALRFVIVGDGPVRAALQRAHPDLLFCGVQTGAQLATHYASGDVFLFPSETETFGNVVLEAMASGLAVVAYNYAAARTHITHGKSGVLVPYADSRAFVESAAALVRAPRSVRAMGGRAREETTSVDWPSVVRQFEMLLSGARLESRISMSGDGARAVMLRRG